MKKKDFDFDLNVKSLNNISAISESGWHQHDNSVSDSLRKKWS